MAYLALNKITALNCNAVDVIKPTATMLQLPEKVLQFGTGALLRGLPDYYIDKANRAGIFNGKIIVVKSTDKGSGNEFDEQDALFTHCIKGIVNGKMVEENIINSSISRVLSATNQWQQIVQSADNIDIQLIISNTTEVGIVLAETDSIHDTPPASFPGKLLAWLYRRFQTFEGSKESGVTIIPTELVTDNGTKLKLIVQQLAEINQLPPSFIQWLTEANDFCNSLVDRIVPGKLPSNQYQVVTQNLGYQDKLMIMSEAYSLWAIETSNTRTKDLLSFTAANHGIVLAPNINKFRELKLRLLNGTHTFSCGLAFLAGFRTVKDAMHNSYFSLYIQDLMQQEIAPCLEGIEISRLEAYEFAKSVIERFRNPHLEHLWLSISFSYTRKMQMRNIPLLLKHYANSHLVPELMAAGFAGYILFMKSVEQNDGKYYGKCNNELYLIDDDYASWYHEVWNSGKNLTEIVEIVLGNASLWGDDLRRLPNFTSTVQQYLSAFMQNKYVETLKQLENHKKSIGI